MPVIMLTSSIHGGKTLVNTEEIIHTEPTTRQEVAPGGQGVTTVITGTAVVTRLVWMGNGWQQNFVPVKETVEEILGIIRTEATRQ